jgi:Domain of unknown function (DUF6089)
MKKNYWFLLLAMFSLPLAGQRNADFGVFGGVSSYIGDINPDRLMYSPLPAAGFFYRFNFHPRQSLRTSFFFGGIAANDLDFHNAFQQARAASFSGTVGEWSTQFEFNFFPYSTQGKRWNCTPYIAGGVGITFINTVVFTYQPVIPFSLGFKINLYKNFGLEVEYGFRKTFYDNFDGLKDFIAPSDYSWYHNNDWYSFAGLSITWKMYNRLAGCPAFNDVDTRKKR